MDLNSQLFFSDALELGGGLDTIPSFKMDMSDLDFSSLCKKDDKTKNPSKDSVNKEMKQDKFSFTFDFNECVNSILKVYLIIHSCIYLLMLL